MKVGRKDVKRLRAEVTKEFSRNTELQYGTPGAAQTDEATGFTVNRGLTPML
jgi:hypothetical protein